MGSENLEKRLPVFEEHQPQGNKGEILTQEGIENRMQSYLALARENAREGWRDSVRALSFAEIADVSGDVSDVEAARDYANKDREGEFQTWSLSAFLKISEITKDPADIAAAQEIAGSMSDGYGKDYGYQQIVRTFLRANNVSAAREASRSIKFASIRSVAYSEIAGVSNAPEDFAAALDDAKDLTDEKIPIGVGGGYFHTNRSDAYAALVMAYARVGNIYAAQGAAQKIGAVGRKNNAESAIAKAYVDRGNLQAALDVAKNFQPTIVVSENYQAEAFAEIAMAYAKAGNVVAARNLVRRENGFSKNGPERFQVYTAIARSTRDITDIEAARDALKDVIRREAVIDGLREIARITEDPADIDAASKFVEEKVEVKDWKAHGYIQLYRLLHEIRSQKDHTGN